MTYEPDPGLVQWVDDLAEAVHRLSTDPARWARFVAAPPHRVDIDEDFRSAGNMARIAWRAAWRVVRQSYLDSGGDPRALLPDDIKFPVMLVAGPPGTIPDINASSMARALYAIAHEAAMQAAVEIASRWGGEIPAGLPQLEKRRRQRAVERALASQRPGETVSEVLARAGVSRAQGYRIMGRKSGQ
jgi:hypothetical protein